MIVLGDMKNVINLLTNTDIYCFDGVFFLCCCCCCRAMSRILFLWVVFRSRVFPFANKINIFFSCAENVQFQPAYRMHVCRHIFESFVCLACHTISLPHTSSVNVRFDWGITWKTGCRASKARHKKHMRLFILTGSVIFRFVLHNAYN